SNESSIILNGKFSEPFPISNGVLQGSILSPFLYSIFINDLCDTLWKNSNQTGLLNLKWQNIPCLLYADDIALIASSTETVQTLLNICSKHAADNNYLFNYNKCEYLSNVAPDSLNQP